MAELHGIPVIDDPRSIQICSDKVNMYLHLMKRGIAIPRTAFLSKNDLVPSRIRDFFADLGIPLVLKEPSTSFSLRVEKVSTPQEFLRVAKRFMKLSDWIVVQQYIESTYDWRIGVLDGEFLYACKYIIPSETFKIQATVNGHVVYCAVRSVKREEVPPVVVDLAVAAANAIGRGFYGIDIKESVGKACVIEVNDNPSLEGGEDACYPHIFQRIITSLLESGHR
jgi:glutathione synthase/RimK-type ligase-like ATP-grasp enzyme